MSLWRCRYGNWSGNYNNGCYDNETTLLWRYVLVAMVTLHYASVAVQICRREMGSSWDKLEKQYSPGNWSTILMTWCWMSLFVTTSTVRHLSVVQCSLPEGIIRPQSKQRSKHWLFTETQMYWVSLNPNTVFTHTSSWCDNNVLRVRYEMKHWMVLWCTTATITQPDRNKGVRQTGNECVV